MKCRGCGYVSLEERESCPSCGGDPRAPAAASPAPGAARTTPRRGRRARTVPPPAPPADADGGLHLAADEAAPAPAVPQPQQLVLPIGGGRAPLVRAGADDLASLVELAADENLPDIDAEEPPPAPALEDPGFVLDDELIPPPLPRSGGRAWALRRTAAFHEDFRLPYEEPAEEQEGGAAIIDRDDEVPEQFWAAEGAPFGRRAAAVAVDAAANAVILAVFAAGAWLALRGAGLDAEALLAGPVLRAVVLPFGLLALLLNLAYCVAFHAAGGCTPGKRAAGIEVKAVDGGELSAGRCLLRWLAAALAAGAAGAGVLWGLFEPRRRGWADLLSGTVVAQRRPERAPAP